MTDFDTRRRERPWLHDSTSFRRLFAEITGMDKRRISHIPEETPFLCDAAAWVIPAIAWSLIKPDGRLYIMFDTAAGRTTLTADSREEAEELPSWQHDFFRSTSGGIAIGFSGEITDAEWQIRSRPVITKSADPTIISQLADGRIRAALEIADFIMLPTVDDFLNGRILTTKTSEDAATALIRAALGARARVIESATGYQDWMRYGRFPTSDFRL
jgi:hypothetical protein